MKLSYFNFVLPKELIAEKPSKQRDEARLMVLHKDTQQIEHRLFKDLLDYLHEGDVVVANNTKVFPALLYGEKEKTGAKITVFLQRELNKEMRLWDVIVDPARKIRIGNQPIHHSLATHEENRGIKLSTLGIEITIYVTNH